MKDDYINFTFNGINSDELGLTRVSNGSRYTDSLTPSFKDTTVEIEGANGVIYFKTNYGTKEITVLTAFDHITEPQLRRIRQVFSGDDVHELSFYEAPYKVYNAKVSSAPNFEFVTFLEEEKETTIDPETGAQVVTEKTVKVFKGECSISFVVFDSFAHTPSNGKFLDSSTYNEYTNLNEVLEEILSIAVFENTDVERSNPIRASQYLLLNGEAFTHASNLNYEKVKADICSMEHHILLLDNTTYLLLNVLRGYDAQKNKDLRLLDLADSICDWLAAYGEQIDSQILKLNKFQIIKRRRALTTLEIIEVGKLIEEADTPNIKCGAYLLLEEIERAQQCFDKLSPEAQEEFMTFPICHFGILKKNGESNDGESV